MKQQNIAEVDLRNQIDCLEQENRLLKKRNQELIGMLEQQTKPLQIDTRGKP